MIKHPMKGGYMMRDTKGLSAVITTLIIILLVLVAIGIIWVVVNNVLQSGAQQTEISAKCLQIDLRATAATCDNDTSICSVTYHRGTGGDAIDGAKIIFSNGQESYEQDVLGNVAPLATNTTSAISTGLSPVPNSVEISAFFIDASGNQQLCSATSTFTF
jgi:hypothetical protein